MLLDEGLHVGLLDGLLHDGEGRDHLDVGQGHVARSGRRRDLGVLELRGEAVHVRKGQTRGLKGLEGQGGGDGLRSAARTDGVLAFISGVVFFGANAPENFNAVTWSLWYNFTYIAAEGAITVAVLCVHL